MMVINPVTGMAIVGGVQALGNILSGNDAENAARVSARANERMLRQSIDERRQSTEDVQGYVDPYYQAGVSALGQLQGIDESQYMPEYGQFQYEQGVQDFLDPSMQYQAQQAGRALEGSAAAQGGLLSGNTLRELQAQQSQIGAQDWGNANQRMMQDKAFAYGQFQDRFNAQRATLSDLYNRQTSRLGGLAQSGQNAANTMANARIGEAQGVAGDLTSIGSEQAAAAQAPYMQNANIMQQLTNPNLIAPMLQQFGGGQAQQPQYGGQQQQYTGNAYMSGLNPSLMNQMNPNGLPQGNL